MPTRGGARTLLRVLAAAQLVLVLDSSVITIAIPRIQAGLALSPRQVQWAISAYGVAFGGFLLVGGRAADVYGPRKMFTIGMVSFGLASLGAAFANSSASLIVSRFGQGFSAATAVPAAFALLTTSFPGQARQHALAVTTALVCAGFSLGAILGGVLTTVFGWRSVFLVNVPLAAAVVLAVRMTVTAERKVLWRPLGMPSAISGTGGVVALVWAISGLASHAYVKSAVGLCASSSLGALFLRAERRSKYPLILHTILKDRQLLNAAAAALLVNASTSGLLLLLALFLEHVLRLTPLATSCIFVAPGAGAMLGARLGPLAATLGRRALLGGGLFLQAAGTLILLTLGSAGPLEGAVPATAVAVGAYELVAVALALDISSRLALSDQGVAGGLFHTAAVLGSAIGLVVALTVGADLATGVSPHVDPGSLTTVFHRALLMTATFIAVAAIPVRRLCAARPAAFS